MPDADKAGLSPEPGYEVNVEGTGWPDAPQPDEGYVRRMAAHSSQRSRAQRRQAEWDSRRRMKRRGWALVLVAAILLYWLFTGGF